MVMGCRCSLHLPNRVLPLLMLFPIQLSLQLPLRWLLRFPLHPTRQDRYVPVMTLHSPQLRWPEEQLRLTNGSLTAYLAEVYPRFTPLHRSLTVRMYL